MKAPVLFAMAATLLLGGCAHHFRPGAPGSHAPGGGHGAATDGGPRAWAAAAVKALEESKQPKLRVDGQTIRVSREVLAFPTGSGPHTITWQLEGAEGWTFDAKAGIVVEGEVLDELQSSGDRRWLPLGPQDQIVDCRPLSEPKNAFACTNRATRQGVFKYTIQLRSPQGTVLRRDPPIVNW